MIVIDVGANKGELAMDICPRVSDVTIFAVEPNYILFQEQLKALEDKFPNRFHFVPAALADFDGTARLYAPQHMEGQIGSLLKIDDNNSWMKEIKNNFSTDKLDESIEVEVFSVQKFLNKYKITDIDFLKIDSQGTDLLILNEFLINSIVKVAAVEIEVTPSGSNSHYKNANNSFHDLLTVLQRTKYEIIRIMPANTECNEYNVFIAKSYKDYEKVDQELSFHELKIFSRFWKVLGIGNDSVNNLKTLQLLLIRKMISAFTHPITSYRSLLIKLTS